MKGINKIIALVLIGSIVFIFFSCKTASTVTFESESFLDYKQNKLEIQDAKGFYFSRIMTQDGIDFILFKFSKEKEFDELKIDEISISDEVNEIIFNESKISIKANSFFDEYGVFYYKIYSYKLSEDELVRLHLKNYKTKYLMLKYEIEGVEYIEKLIRNEKKSLVLPT